MLERVGFEILDVGYVRRAYGAYRAVEQPSAPPMGSAPSYPRTGEPTRRRDLAVPAPAPGQPGRLVPVGAEAFAAAEERDVPILLSVGYSACHWCHVMAHESFEDAEVAERDERAVRQRQGRPGGTARRRRGLHGRGAGDDRARRLADDGVPDARRRAVLRRHVLPQAAVPPAADARSTTRGATAATTSAENVDELVDRDRDEPQGRAGDDLPGVERPRLGRAGARPGVRRRSGAASARRRSSRRP